MRQFEVFDNPIPAARPALPLVAILQSDVAETGRGRVIAPLARSRALPGLAGRLIPIVEVAREDCALLVRSLTTLPVRDLRRAVATSKTIASEFSRPWTTSLSGSEVMALHRKERSGAPDS